MVNYGKDIIYCTAYSKHLTLIRVTPLKIKQEQILKNSLYFGTDLQVPSHDGNRREGTKVVPHRRNGGDHGGIPNI